MKIQRFILSLGFGCLSLATVIPHDSSLERHQESSDSSASATSWGPCDLDLEYQGDQDDFECARLKVPLDYTNCSNHESIQLDVIKLKALNEPSKGSILFNPGGPGLSGVQALAERGNDLMQVTGGQHDIIGFDPRGTGRTLKFSCGGDIGSNVQQSLSRRGLLNALPVVEAWETVKNLLWEHAGSQFEVCNKEHADTGRFIGTAAVARDMLTIVDALGQGPELNYWGVSYGTVLGQVFVSMFPNRVGRILLDGNLLADNFLTKNTMGFSRDTESGLFNMLNACVEAGPDLCSLADYAGNGTSAADLMEGLVQRLDGIQGEVVDIGDETINGTELTVSMKSTFFSSLKALRSLVGAVELVKAALDGDWEKVNNISSGTASLSYASWQSQSDTASAHLGIWCSDSSWRAQDVDDMYSMYQAHLSENSFGDAVANERFACARWGFAAAEPVNTDRLRNIETSNPVLLINSPYDPVTPLNHAFEASSRMRGSRVLVHEAVGHGLIRHQSNCTIKAVQNYFINGTMPEVGTTCKPNLNAFEAAALDLKAAEAAKEEN